MSISRDNTSLFYATNSELPKINKEDFFFNTLTNPYLKFSSTEKLKFCNSIINDEIKMDSLKRLNITEGKITFQ